MKKGGQNEISQQLNEQCQPTDNTTWGSLHKRVIDFIEENFEKLIIAFVEEFEKAHQYCSLKEYVKLECEIMPNSDPDIIFNIIVDGPLRNELFEKLEDLVIEKAINRCIHEVAFPEEMHIEYEKVIRTSINRHKLDEGRLNSAKENDEFSDMGCEREKYLRVGKYIKDMKRRFRKDLTHFEQKADGYAFRNVIYVKVLQIRRGEYVMDLNPRKELIKILKSDPRRCFNLHDVFEKMMNSEQPKICNQIVRVNIAGHYEPPSTMGVEDVKDEPSVEMVEEFVRCMYEKALKKYRDLHMRYHAS